MESKNIGKYTVTVDTNLCIGAATCVAIAPTVFKLVNGKAVFGEGGEEVSEGKVLMAAQSCPVKAVIITVTATGEKVWPI